MVVNVPISRLFVTSYRCPCCGVHDHDRIYEMKHEGGLAFWRRQLLIYNGIYPIEQNPIRVYCDGDDYIIEDGHTRALACYLFGFEYVPAIILGPKPPPFRKRSGLLNVRVVLAETEEEVTLGQYERLLRRGSRRIAKLPF